MCEYYALEGLTQLLRNVELVQRNLNPALEIEGVILTMLDARTGSEPMWSTRFAAISEKRPIGQSSSHRPALGSPLIRGAHRSF